MMVVPRRSLPVTQTAYQTKVLRPFVEISVAMSPLNLSGVLVAGDDSRLLIERFAFSTPNVLGVLLVIKSRPKERFSLQSKTTFLKDDYTANNAFS